MQGMALIYTSKGKHFRVYFQNNGGKDSSKRVIDSNLTYRNREAMHCSIK